MNIVFKKMIKTLCLKRPYNITCECACRTKIMNKYCILCD